MNLEDAAARCHAGDLGAFRLLVEATSPRLLRLAARLMGSLPEGEDILQESYVKAHQALVHGRFDRRASVHTWLYRIVVNTAIDALRRVKRRHTLDPEVLPTPAAPRGQEAELALAELGGWLAALPPDQRVALTLKAIEGLTSSEIATIMGCSEGAVEQRLVRARTTLRERQRTRD